MVYELMFNIVLLISFVYCFFSLNMLPSTLTNEMSAKSWPQALLLLLIFCTCLNIYKICKKKPLNQNFKIENLFSKTLLVNIVNFKFIIGAFLCLLYPFGLKYIGFIPTSLFFIYAYMSLLGEKKPKNKILASFFTTSILYFIFHIILKVPLSRGVGLFRIFALFLEGFFQ